MSFWDFWNNLFGCQYWKDLVRKEQEYSDELETQLEICYEDKAKLKETIAQLELLIPPQYPPPDIGMIAQKDAMWVQDVIDGMGLSLSRFPLDQTYYLTNQTNFLNIVAWDWVDSFKYKADRYDCENFAISFKAHVDEVFGLNQVAVILDYKSGHGYNLVIYPDGNVHILEPQSDQMWLWTKRIKDFYSLEGAIVLI